MYFLEIWQTKFLTKNVHVVQYTLYFYFFQINVLPKIISCVCELFTHLSNSGGQRLSMQNLYTHCFVENIKLHSKSGHMARTEILKKRLKGFEKQLVYTQLAHHSNSVKHLLAFRFSVCYFGNLKVNHKIKLFCGSCWLLLIDFGSG